MATTGIDAIARLIMQQEGSMDFSTNPPQPRPGSVNATINRTYGRWNVGHLVWAGQGGAIPVTVNDRQWASWPTYNDAYQGLLRQIRLDAGRGDTIDSFIKGTPDPKTGKLVGGYAPGHENNSEAYVQYLASGLAVSPYTKLMDIINGTVPTANPTPAPPARQSQGQVRVVGKEQTSKRCPTCGQTLPPDSKT